MHSVLSVMFAVRGCPRHSILHSLYLQNLTPYCNRGAWQCILTLHLDNLVMNSPAIWIFSPQISDYWMHFNNGQDPYMTSHIHIVTKYIPNVGGAAWVWKTTIQTVLQPQEIKRSLLLLCDMEVTNFLILRNTTALFIFYKMLKLFCFSWWQLTSN